jgi:hypothetical protein
MREILKGPNEQYIRKFTDSRNKKSARFLGIHCGHFPLLEREALKI